MLRFVIAIFLVLPLAALAHDYEKDGIHIADAWAETVPDRPDVLRGYLSIISMDLKGDRLIGAHSPDAGSVELQTNVSTAGGTRAEALPEIRINPMGGADLTPGGHHLLISDIRKSPRSGDRISVTLIFETVGEFPIRLRVR